MGSTQIMVLSGIREGMIPNIHFKVPLRLISCGQREIREILDDIEGMPEKYWAGKYKYILGRNKSLGSEWEISSTMLPSLAKAQNTQTPTV